ncbi:MAG TPA: hypothetical protein VNK95_09515, partial [Caldilineaceae bacterium]|nr:hypothetical protein [Caldilineaceae bacterium]
AVERKALPAHPGLAPLATAPAVQFLPLLVQPSNPITQPVDAQATEPDVKAPVFTAPLPRQPIEPQRVRDRENRANMVCAPRYAFTGDRYLCYTKIEGQLQLWLASDSKGAEKLLVEGMEVTFRWADGGQHIVFSPVPPPPQDPFNPSPGEVRPVYWMNVESGERKEIGQTTSISLDANLQGDVAFLHEDTLFVVNPLTGTARRLASAFTIGHPPAPTFEPLLPSTPEVMPEFLQATPVPADQAFPTPQPPPTFSQQYPYLELRFALSPHGHKVILHQIAGSQGSLVLVDLDTQAARLLTTHAGHAWAVYGWSPDGRQVAYATYDEEHRRPELWLIPSEGDAPPRLLTAEENRGLYEWVTWHPNGQDLLYVFTPWGTHGNAWAEYRVMNVAQGDSYTLFTSGYFLELFDGGRQIFFSREYLEGQIDRVDRDGWIARLAD